jgi:Na+/melibiose symporter-like transporter
MTQDEAPPLSVGTKISYGVGQVAEGLKNTAMATFVLFYYNQVLGLSGTLAGLALGIALVFDAMTDPIAGSISDNLTSRMGRRHPFIYAAALPLAVAFFLMFFPPVELLGQWGLFAWLTVTVVLTRAAMTLFHVPHIALGAELSDDYEERTTVVSFRYFFSTFGSLLVFILGFGLFFTEARGGQVVPGNYPPFALTLAVLMVVTVLWTGWGTRHRIPYLSAPEPGPDLTVWQTVLRMFKDTGRALQNRTFRWLFSGVLILFVMVGVDFALNLYMFNYFWELQAWQILWLFLALPIGALVGAPLTRYLHRYISKHATVLLGTAWFAVFELTPVLLRLLEWFPANDSPSVFWILLATRFFMGLGSIQSNVSFNSMMADIADLHELETGKRQEGIFFGAISFSAKGTSGLGNVVAGVGLDIIAWPRGADIRSAADVPPETIVNLGILYGPLVGLFALVALWCLSHYDLTRERHAEIQAELAQRRRRKREAAATPLEHARAP